LELYNHPLVRYLFIAVKFIQGCLAVSLVVAVFLRVSSLFYVIKQFIKINLEYFLGLYTTTNTHNKKCDMLHIQISKFCCRLLDGIIAAPKRHMQHPKLVPECKTYLIQVQSTSNQHGILRSGKPATSIPCWSQSTNIHCAGDQ